MNRLEKIIYDAVKNNVALKIFIKKLYQSLFLIVKPKKIDINCKYTFVEGFFFGFHDKSPWNDANHLILAHRVNAAVKDIPGAQDVTEVGYFEDEGLRRFRSVGSTCSWNWQQGAMLQWMGEGNTIIFNAWDEKLSRNIARIVDLDSKVINELPFPVGAVSNDGKNVVSYDFERLNTAMRGYGYARESKDIRAKDSDIPDSLGFKIYSVLDKRDVVFKSIEELNEGLGDRKFRRGYLFVTHFLFSPDSQRLLFLLRSYSKGKRLRSRLLSCDIVGENMHVFPTGEMVSHLSWKGSEQVLAYCTDQNEKEGYYLFNDKSEGYLSIGEKDFKSDGHPQFQETVDTFVTDTYPDRKRLQELSVFHLGEKRKQTIGRFFSPVKFSDEFRCDLHPRWDRRGEKICIDTTFSGKRAMAIITLDRD